MRTFVSAFVMVILFGLQAVAQDAMPKVFLMGDNEKEYEQLTQDYAQSLLEVCNNDMEAAFGQWLEMVKEMELYAQKIKFDLKGVKLRLHVFFSPDGKIDHIGYLLRGDSRNINTAEMSAFLSSFINRYKFGKTSDKKFSHYTGATFPTYVERFSE